jgi:large subunit ribosomal protein L15
MDLSNLTPAPGSVKKEKKRLGRGQGSGKGGTSTRGHKGAKARSGYSKKVGFEGGQMPMHRRLPKFGFKNINRVEYKAINLRDIQILADKLDDKIIDIEVMIEHGLIKRKDLVKILGNGTLTSKIEIKAHAFSKTAIKAIEALEGTVVKL